MAELSIDELRGECVQLANDITNHLKLLRDYATAPGDSWLARSELSKINALLSDYDNLLAKIKQAEASAGGQSGHPKD